MYNAEIYHCGYVNIRFTITSKWQVCFAVLTRHRHLFIFELKPVQGADSNISQSIDCNHYLVYNLRKTVQINWFDLSGNSTNSSNNSVPFKRGFNLVQNGGNVVYISSEFESHVNVW